MKHIFPIVLFLALVSCSDPEKPVEATSSEDEKSPSTSAAPASIVSPDTQAVSPVFDPLLCKFLTEAQIKQTLGDQITGVSIQDPSITAKSCQKIFTLTLADGNPLKLIFRIEQSSEKGVRKLLKEYTDNAKTIPRMFKMENASDGQSFIGTLIGHRRLAVFRPGQTSIVILTYDVRGAGGGKTPEEIETRRQMGLSLIAQMLKE